MRRLPALLLGVGLAVAPSSAVAGPDKPDPEVETFESYTFTSRARLGVLVIQLTPELRKHFGAAEDRGVLIGRIEPKSAAAAAGLMVGDVITDVRGTSVDDAPDVISALAPAKAGEKVALQVIRNGKPLSLTATMTENRRPSGALESRRLDGTWPKWLRDMFETWPSPLPDKPSPQRSTST